MPFTISGEWIPEPTPTKKTQPIKIIKEKRRASFVTIILNLPENISLKDLCSKFKQQFGCGGSVKNESIELQGDQVQSVKTQLKQMGLKIS